ncbi:hypothetical protein HanRHA438_Chr11g0495161 [Helianthus annuus]|nr:hypothetical protein HanRHA438_Chr11g0495161 [Helianthus annuus]
MLSGWMNLQNLCYVAIFSYEVPVVGWFTLKQEPFLTGEILFQPLIAGLYVHVSSILSLSVSITAGNFDPSTNKALDLGCVFNFLSQTG